MKIKLENAATGETVAAEIKRPGSIALPSIQENWRFNFHKQAKLPNATAYVLTNVETPEVIEGCLIFQMLDNQEPHMAFVEVAPHNRGNNRKFKLVAECLIAFACRLSFQQGEGHYKGWLSFTVGEPDPKDRVKLMSLYSEKYGAMRVGETTEMLITPEGGESLIEKYLER
jgi:hypothetical protein